MHSALRRRFNTRMLTEKVLLFHCGQGSVRVGAADLAELVRIHTEFLLKLKAPLKAGPGILTRQHLFGLGLAHIEVAEIPGLVVGELVVGG